MLKKVISNQEGEFCPKDTANAIKSKVVKSSRGIKDKKSTIISNTCDVGWVPSEGWISILLNLDERNFFIFLPKIN